MKVQLLHVSDLLTSTVKQSEIPERWRAAELSKVEMPFGDQVSPPRPQMLQSPSNELAADGAPWLLLPRLGLLLPG